MTSRSKAVINDGNVDHVVSGAVVETIPLDKDTRYEYEYHVQDCPRQIDVSVGVEFPSGSIVHCPELDYTEGPFE